MARLNTTVHVYDGVETIVYLPGQEVAPQHREQITAPGVWEDDPETPQPKAQKAAVLKVPAKGGPGSAAPAWRKYAIEATAAAGLHIDIPEDASRDDIIEALTDAGIPTE